MLTQSKIFISLFLMLLLSACSQPVTETPEALVQAYQEAVVTQDTQKAALLFYVSDKDVPQELIGLISQGLQLKFNQLLAEHGPLASIELADIQYAADNTQAIAQVIFIYAHDKKIKEQWLLQKSQNNWKIKIE
ncbi:hypothetical protein VQ643_06360 [Pseudomonas sp. F1_0610]|uniref:hypothetical protein n=1 Tax=Pseudomonas sp. F1_0610 TaxID=3114284 RepID=UPI0039C08F22